MSDLYKLLEEGELKKALELVNEDEYAWEDLLEFLEDADESIRRAAFEIISKSGDNPRLLDALPMLISGLESEEEEICRYAAEALFFLGSDAAEAAESLAALLTYDDDEVRRAVARVFSQMGSGALEVKEALLDALSDSDEVVRGEVALAVANLGSEVPEAIPHLINLLTDEEEFIHEGQNLDVQTAAQAALEKIGPAAVPPLLEAMRVDRADLRVIAITTLAGIGSLSEEAIKDIEDAIQDPDENVQMAAKNALKRLKIED